MRGIGARTLWALSLLAGAVLATPGCTSGAGGWDVRGLERRHPELSLHAGHRLGDASPYFAPAGDGLALFLCRWSTARAVPVALPSDASPEERDLLLRALTAWEGAGLGLEFRVGPAIPDADSRRGIEIEFVAPIIGRGTNQDVQALLAQILTNQGIQSCSRGYTHQPLPSDCQLAVEHDTSLQDESRYRGLSWSKLEVKTIENIIRPCGLSPQKSKAISGLSKILLD